MSSLWRDVYEFDSRFYGFPVYNTVRFHTGYASQNITSPYFPLTKGLNRRIPLNLYMRYAVAGYECWTASCSLKTLSGLNKTPLGDNLYFDVFPATLDGFYSLNWDSRFGRQLDRDGDGLLSRTASSGGLDPDDTTHDSDGDGLPDGSEVRLGTSNSSGDTDGDGLSDYLEAILGTDSTRADTDRDGLTDAVEVNGWQFTYGTGLSTWVTTDPRLRNSDNDGLDDRAEKNLGTNPRATTAGAAGVSVAVNDLDRVITYGSSLVYTSTVSNDTLPGAYDPAANLTLSGNLLNTFPAELGGLVATSPIVLSRSAAFTRTIPFSVPAGSGSRISTISARANGSLLAVYPASSVNIGAFDYTKTLDMTIDDDNPTSSLSTQFVPAGRTVMIGGSASDPTSYITQVEVQIDGGPWQVATPVGVTPRGNAAYPWALAWAVPPTEGAHTVRTRATDAVGHLQPTVTTATLYVDAQAPTVTANMPANIVAASRGEDNRWSITLGGTATDPGSGATVSGVETVQVSLTPDGTGWQDATLTPTGTNMVAWSIDYAFPDLGKRNPTGLYQVQVRAIDGAGNETPELSYAGGDLRLDDTPPNISLNEIPASGLSAGGLITDTITIGGVISETDTIQVGIAGGEISYTPDIVTDVYSDTLLLLFLDDLSGSTTFRDDSGNNIATTCTSTSCPTAAAPGRFGRGVQFDSASNQTLGAANVAINPAAYSIVEWFKTSCTNCGISGVNTQNGAVINTDRQIYLSGGNLCVDVVNGSRESICSADVTVNDNQWHMVAQTVGPGGQKLYIDGQLAGSGLKTSSSFVGDSSLVIGAAQQATSTTFSGVLDEIKVFPVALTPALVAGLYESWSPVTVTQTGPGVLTSDWSTQVPAGLEGVYEIDLTATDTLDNRNDRRIDWNHWQGEIDTRAPRVSIQVTYSGSGNTTRTTYTGYAEDLNLTEDNLQFPCQNPTITRTYNTLTRPGEPQRLNRLDLTCRVNGIQQSETGWLRVCDAYDHCVARRAPNYRIYAATDRGIIRANPADGSQIETLVPATVSDPTAGLAFDTDRGKMYWVSGATIMRANPDGTTIETVLTGLNSPRRIAINSAAGKLYWNEPTQIKRANLDGSGVETVVTASDPITSMALDPARGKLYWSLDGPACAQISSTGPTSRGKTSNGSPTGMLTLTVVTSGLAPSWTYLWSRSVATCIGQYTTIRTLSATTTPKLSWCSACIRAQVQ